MQQGLRAEVYTTTFTPLKARLAGRAEGAGLQQGFVKMLVECGSGKVLGLHMVGEEAPEIIQVGFGWGGGGVGGRGCCRCCAGPNAAVVPTTASSAAPTCQEASRLCVIVRLDRQADTSVARCWPAHGGGGGA
jgi:hypothetical protein